METLFTILAGVVGLIGTAIPVYFTWKKYHDKQKKEVNIAADNVARRDRFLERVRKRKKASG